MMTNMFNIFDPSTNSYISMNWLSTFIILFLFPLKYWLLPSRMSFFWKLITNNLLKEFKILLKFSFSNLIMFISIFFFIFWNNFMGLFPYIFTASSHMSLNLSLALSIWISIMIFGWINFFNDMMTHLTPSNTPSILMPFMVMIELTSLLIRPLTLSIRLTANMIAGHLLLSLLGSSGLYINSLNMIIFSSFMLTQISLYALEIAVSMIQAYVFTILSLLYSSEI